MAFLDVGQGDGALVLTPGGKSLLVDGGPGGAGPRVLQALRTAGVRRLDWVMGSHPHEDHIGGLNDVLAEVPAVQVLDPGYNNGTATQRKYLSLLKQCGAKVIRARAGQTYDLGAGCRLEIAAPKEPLLTGTDSDANNNSIVARLVYGRTRCLFTGDMEEKPRTHLLDSAASGSLQADVLKVAHHGSHNGTDAPFLRAVAPQYAVISCARGNDYGHPHREAMAALRSQGCPILRTDERGDIRFTSDGTQVRLEGGRAESPARAAALDGGEPAQTPGSGSEGPGVPRAGQVIGNRSSRVYHQPDCGALPDSDRRVVFESATAAQTDGYRAHRTCNR